MSHIISYNEFVNQQKVDEGLLANIALGVLTTLASIGGAHAQTKTSEPHKSVQHAKTTSEQRAVQLVNKGWQIDSTKLDTIWKTNPKAEVLVTEFNMDLSQGFESGRFKLNEESKKAIDSVFADLQEDGQIVTKIVIESSTDKTPISQRMQKETGIKTNADLSEARSNSIIQYLLEQGLVSKENAKEIEKILLSEQGTKDDPTARYVKLVIYSMIPADVQPGGTEKEVTTYYLSKENQTKKPQKIKSNSHGKVKVFKKPAKNYREYCGAVKCAITQ